MSHAVHPALALIFEFLFAFLTASLIVLTILRIAPWPAVSRFPVTEALEITFLCTLVVLAGARAAGGVWWWYHDPGVSPSQKNNGELQPERGRPWVSGTPPFLDAKLSRGSVMV
ncbi:hypothetical protein DFH06DRAFT_1169259 [Mycena polygramma]|nr:hypothetical protein DFH06DRAFT_1169259 [Mycena polygramma]